MEFERRILLKILALLPIFSTSLFKSQTALSSPLDSILEKARRESAFNKLGRTYLPKEFHRLSPSSLEQELLNHIDYSQAMHEEDIAMAICKRVRMDFQDDQVIDCQGWQLSKTEVLLAALC